MFNQKQISADSFERRKASLDSWKSKNYQLLEQKKNKYLMFYGKLTELEEEIMKSKKDGMIKNWDRDSSFSDFEHRFAGNISHSDISNRHERHRSGNYLHTDIRNHVKDKNQYSFASTDEQKFKEKLNSSKDSEKLNDRLFKFEILKEKDKFNSSKGPVMARSSNEPFLPNEESNDTKNAGRKSESIPANPNLEDYIIDDKKSKSNELKEFLKERILEAQKQNEELSKGHPVNKDSDDLIGFPSDDETSKKIKNDVINEIDSFHSDALKNPEKNCNYSENEELVENKIDEEKDLQNQEELDLKNTEESQWPPGFPSIGDKTSKDGDIKRDIIARSNSDILEDILKNENNEQDSLCNEDLLANPTINEESENLDLKEANDKNDYEEDTDSFHQPSPEATNKHDILIQSTKSNISNSNDLIFKQSRNEDLPSFSEEEQKINKSFRSADVQEEDTIPEKPFSLDIDNIPKIDKNFKNEDLLEKKETAEVIFEQIKEPSLSIKDIMCDDLTGNVSNVNAKKKSRTADDLVGGPAVKTKQEKVDAIADEILYYLVSECHGNFFPQRVNPTK